MTVQPVAIDAVEMPCQNPPLVPEKTAAKREVADRLWLAAMVLVLAGGCFLRVYSSAAFQGLGFDEGLYRGYVNALINGGLTAYPDIVDHYIEVQRTLVGSILPPMRFLYIFAAYLWHLAFRTEALRSLHQVASCFSVLTLLLATAFGWRLKGRNFALGIGALMACAPTQLHVSQHALVDGFFTFWALLALWLLWENLQSPGKWELQVGYLLSLCLLVLTKENSFFVWCSLVTLIVTNRWLGFGKVSRELVLATVVGPLLGVVILVFLSGGLSTLITSYQLSVSKNFQLPYAILTGDGPWHRYLVDLLLVSPVILLLAIGAVFRLHRSQKPELFMIIFIGLSYLIMCNLRYGMNLRYANMWDMPLRVLALSQLIVVFGFARAWRQHLIVLAVAAICAVELHQYLVLCIRYPLYELVTEGLLRALHILKLP
jgi:4-amino-4-deoxy-L-arabinose transferase and related glycosyltransferases of PMT family